MCPVRALAQGTMLFSAYDKTMEKIVSKIAGMGIPGLLLLVAVGATGLSGAAAITAALAAIGFGGMYGGNHLSRCNRPYC